jgi:AraC family transcriptional activator of tynA and feaB
MSHVDIFATGALAPNRRIQYWNDLASEAFTPQVVDARDRARFEASLKLLTMQGLVVAEVISDAASIHHSSRHAEEARRQRFFIEVQLEGQSVITQDGREARLQPGDFTLCDTSRAYEVAFEQPVSMLILSLDATRLRRFVGNPELVTAIQMDGTAGLSAVASGLMRSFWSELKRAQIASIEAHMTEAMLNALACAYITVPRACSSGATLAMARRLSILREIEDCLTDPELTPSTIAAKCNMSPRYAHRLFETEGETMRQYILRRRLEVCCQMLENPTLCGRSITAIATDGGFSSLAQFCNVFRERYGITPTEYRAMKTAQPATRIGLRNLAIAK